ncbi:hypothetical protein [Moraxella lacunata]
MPAFCICHKNEKNCSFSRRYQRRRTLISKILKIIQQLQWLFY